MAQLLPKWGKVDLADFSTHHFDMFKAYSTTLRNLIGSKAKLQEMVDQAREAQEHSNSEEEAEEEQIEELETPMGDIPDEPKTSLKATPMKGMTQPPEQISPDSILLKPGEKRPMSVLGVENGEKSFKMQRCEKLEELY